MTTRGARQYVRHNIWNETQADGSLKWYTIDPASDEVIEIPAEQVYFWTDEWQEGEHAVDEDVAAGRVKTFDTMADFLADLDNDDE